MSGARVTGVQAAQVAIAACIEGWRDQLSPREYTILIELLGGSLAAERERVGRSPIARRYLDDGAAGS